MPLLTHLECSNCGRVYDTKKPQTFCSQCQVPLLARYNLEKARQQLDRDELIRRPKGLWRWQELLPVGDPTYVTSLGEGDTPLLPVHRIGTKLGLSHLYVKDESLNPTGSFKARGLSVAVSKARELGISKVVIPSAGNAGGALSAYAARAGLQAHVIMPDDTPTANILECRLAGAIVTLIDGLISDAAVLAKEMEQKEAWFDVSTFKEPYRVEGKKIMGYELAQAFGWELPDVVVYPTGGGTGLVGMWKAFAEMATLGWLRGDSLPRMVAVQADGCAPVVKAFESGSPYCDFWEDAHTIAVGLRVPKSFADQLILRVIRESKGTAVSVTDQAILEAQRRLATQEGIFAAPEGAATLAALPPLLKSGWIHPEERIVLFNTATGLKYI